MIKTFRKRNNIPHYEVVKVDLTTGMEINLKVHRAMKSQNNSHSLAIGDTVTTPAGKGCITATDTYNGRVTVEVEWMYLIEFAITEVTKTR
jgi:preprotein translocase subunit YajC